MESSPSEILDYYRAKDADEKLLAQIRVDMDSGRIRTHNEETTKGKMKLERISTNKPDFTKLDQMISAMKGLLEGSGESYLTIEELCAFQDTDGSFKLFDSYQVPSDARVEFCHHPTYIGAAILMKAYLDGPKHLVTRLERALKASLHRSLQGNGFDVEEGCIIALRIFIKGRLQEFLETEREICPEFHQMIHNILHKYNSALLHHDTMGHWGEDYRNEWQEIVENLHIGKRLYAAYCSNMDQSQMTLRCPNATIFGKSYLEDWVLTFPNYANVEKKQGEKTPVLIWEITDKDESSLNSYEGYPKCYDKTETLINVDGRPFSVMLYVMTDSYKGNNKKIREGYKQQIQSSYHSAGFIETISL